MGEAAPARVIRLLIADDQALVRSGFGMILDAQPDLEVVGQAADGLEALDLARQLLPDLVLMDVRMPRMDGIAATRELLTGAVPATAGSDTGESLLAPVILRRLIEDFLAHPPRATAPPDRLKDLTGRELDVLKSLARGLSNSEIAEELYLSAATVKTHIARVLFKLEVRDRVQAVIAAYESGLIQPGR